MLEWCNCGIECPERQARPPKLKIIHILKVVSDGTRTKGQSTKHEVPATQATRRILGYSEPAHNARSSADSVLCTPYLLQCARSRCACCGSRQLAAKTRIRVGGVHGALRAHLGLCLNVIHFAEHGLARGPWLFDALDRSSASRLCKDTLMEEPIRL